MANFISDEEMASIESQAPEQSAQRPRFISDDDMKSMEDAPRDSILGIPATTIEGALRALPFAGGLAGGAAGFTAGLPTVAGAPVGAVAGAGLGAAGGEALANTIRSALNLDTKAKTRAELYTRPLKEGAIAAAGEGAGQVIAKVPALVKGAPAAIRGVMKSGAGDDVASAATFADVGFTPTLKGSAGEIAEATQRVGGKATAGMVTANKNIQNLENVLSQSPTIAGERVRSAYAPIQRGLKESAENLAGTPNMSQFEAGEAFKAGLKSKITERVQPLASRFESIRESAKNVKPEPASLERAAGRLLKQDLAEFADLPQGQAIRKYADMIRGAKSLDSLKQLRSSVGDEIGKAMDSGDGQLAMALGKVKSSIQRLERREILKTAIQRAAEVVPDRAGGKFLSKAAQQKIAEQEGSKIAKDLIGEIKGVNKGWRALMTELEAVASAGGIDKIASPKHLSRIIDDMPSEKIAERFFNMKNYRGLRDVKTHLPDEFEVLRQTRLGQIAEKSMTKGEPDPVKLIRNLKGIGKESREILFGKDGERVLRDMETVVNSLPSKVGASDTPRGLEWFSFSNSPINPKNWAQEAQGAYNYMLLSGKIEPKSQGQMMTKMLPRAAGYAAASGMANDMERGRDKWARSGISKLNEHAGMPVLDENFDMAAADSKLKTLLIQASDLEPGTPAMKKILDKINAEYGGE